MDNLAAHELIISPSQPAGLDRLENGQTKLYWPEEYGRAHLMVRPIQAAEAENKSLGTSDSGEFTIPAPTYQDRYLYTIEQAEHGRVWCVAERFINLDHSINFRDVGGYLTDDDRQVRWGQIYRSGELGDFSSEDWRQFEQIGLKRVFDLRTTDELENKGDNLPAHLAQLYQHQPIYEQANRSRKWLSTLIFNRSKIESMWLNDVYIGRFITNRAKAFGDVIKEIAQDEKRPSLIHCTAGKDRTGISIALLLHILGVPRETIIAEYTLSNIDFDRLLVSIQKDRRRMALFGLKTKHIFPLLTAQAHVLEKTFTHIDKTYGSVDAYIQNECQIDEALCRYLRAELTTKTHN